MELLELAILAVASAFWPILIAVDVVALRAPHPVPLLAWFLAGGLLTTIAEGVAIVFVLDGTPLASTTHRSASGWANIAGGTVALLAAGFLRGRAPKPHRDAASGRWQRAISTGRGYAFGAGVVLNLFPGVFPLLALRHIAALGYSDAVKVVLVVVLYLVTFAFVEVPLVALLVAPARTEPIVAGLSHWVDRNGRRLGIDVLTVGGAYLVARGVIQLA